MNPKHICHRCGYSWHSKNIIMLIPKSCPKCKRYDWNKIKLTEVKNGSNRINE